MKKSKFIVFEIIIAFILICTSVYAVGDTTIAVSPATTEVEKGGELTVTLSLKNVDSNNKVGSVGGYINYNHDIFETVTVDNIEKTRQNTVLIGDEELSIEDLTNKTDVNSSDAFVAFNGTPASGNDIRIEIDFKNGITKDTDLLKIKFKVKDDVSLKTYTNAIKYDLFSITAGNTTLPEVSESINVTVKAVVEKPSDDDNKPENKPNENTQNDDDNKKPANNTVNTNTNTNSNTNTNKVNNTNTNTNTNANTNKSNTNNTLTGNATANDTTVAATNLPATGAKVIVVPAIVLIALAYISYNKYMKYKDI